MTSLTFFLLFIPILAVIFLTINYLFAPHKPYQEKKSPFECGFHSFLGQNRTQFSISFFIFALLFLLFDLEILLVYPYVVSGYSNEIYGLIIMLIFFIVLTLGFAFEIGKKALKIDTSQWVFRLPPKQPNVYIAQSSLLPSIKFSTLKKIGKIVLKDYKFYTFIFIIIFIFMLLIVIFLFCPYVYEFLINFLFREINRQNVEIIDSIVAIIVGFFTWIKEILKDYIYFLYNTYNNKIYMHNNIENVSINKPHPINNNINFMEKDPSGIDGDSDSNDESSKGKLDKGKGRATSEEVETWNTEAAQRLVGSQDNTFESESPTKEEKEEQEKFDREIAEREQANFNLEQEHFDREMAEREKEREKERGIDREREKEKEKEKEKSIQSGKEEKSGKESPMHEYGDDNSGYDERKHIKYYNIAKQELSEDQDDRMQEIYEKAAEKNRDERTAVREYFTEEWFNKLYDKFEKEHEDLDKEFDKIKEKKMKRDDNVRRLVLITRNEVWGIKPVEEEQGESSTANQGEPSGSNKKRERSPDSDSDLESNSSNKRSKH